MEGLKLHISGHKVDGFSDSEIEVLNTLKRDEVKLYLNKASYEMGKELDIRLKESLMNIGITIVEPSKIIPDRNDMEYIHYYYDGVLFMKQSKFDPTLIYGVKTNDTSIHNKD